MYEWNMCNVELWVGDIEMLVRGIAWHYNRNPYSQYQITHNHLIDDNQYSLTGDTNIGDN